MGKEILVNVANRETRIAVLDDNQLVELRVEREEQVVGNIYKGRVENVLPGMDAAFVDIGLERNAFLYVADILPEYIDSDEDDEAEEVVSAPASVAAAPEKEAVAPRSGKRRRRGRKNDRPANASTADETAEESAPNDILAYLADPDKEAESTGFSDEGDDFEEMDPHAFMLQPSDEADAVQADTVAGEEPSDLDTEAMEFEAVSLADANEADTPEQENSFSADANTYETFPEVEAVAVREAREPAPVAVDSADFVTAEAVTPEPVVGFDLQSSGDTESDYADDSDIDAEMALDSEDEIAAEEESVAPEGQSVPQETAKRSNGVVGQAKRGPRRVMRPGRGPRRHVPIQELVHSRQELLLQVVKGPRGTKGSRVSTRMSLPGRYLVLMPDANNLGVSRKIEDARERDRLKTAVERFRQQGYGIIVRTEAEGRSISELYQDYMMLTETWQNIWNKAKTTPAPGLVHQDQSLIYAIMRDAFGSDIDRLIIDSPEDYARAYEIIDRISPDLADRIHLYDGVKPMFEHFKVEDDIERLLRRKVWLRSGGYLVIDQTEALTSIDVNTGKFVGSSGLSETILQTNMEATFEIARQLRLRDIGGMIVLDFIDMDNQRDKKSVMDALFRALKDDRSRTKIATISPLGLIEMTRKRTKETVDVALTDICPYCHGIGRVSSAESVSMQVEREISRLAAEVKSDSIVVLAHPDVAAHLIGEQGEDIDRLERQVRRAVYVRAQTQYHVEKFEVEPGSMGKIEQSYPCIHRGQVVECTVQKSVLSVLPWALAHAEGGLQMEIANGGKFLGQTVRVRIHACSRSYAIGEALIGGGQGQKQGKQQDRGNRQSVANR